MSTQGANTSQWLNDAMQKESYNFLEFLRTSIKDKTADTSSSVQFITMDQLLPPYENSAIVAAHALQHILLLATKGFIAVEQKRAYGHIGIKIVASV